MQRKERVLTSDRKKSVFCCYSLLFPTQLSRLCDSRGVTCYSRPLADRFQILFLDNKTAIYYFLWTGYKRLHSSQCALTALWSDSTSSQHLFHFSKMEFYWVQLLLIPLFFVSDSSTYVIDSPIIDASSYTYSSQGKINL